MTTSNTPAEVYAERLARRQETVDALERAEARLSYSRLAVFAAAAVLVWPALFSRTIAWGWPLLPVAVFVALIVVHDRVARRRLHAERAVAFYHCGLARLEDRWAGTGSPGLAFVDSQHPYAADLDLFGRGSLFELLCAARTAPGERTLADWLCRPAGPDVVRERQKAVEELRPMLRLREELALLGQDVGSRVDPESLAVWGRGRPLLTARWPVAVGAALGLFNAAALVAWLAPQLAAPPEAMVSLFEGSGPFALALLLSAIFTLGLRTRVRRVLGAVEQPEHELELLSEILSRLEREQFDSTLLAQLRAKLDAASRPPSTRIRRLAWLVQINESRHNLVFAPFAGLFLLGTQLACAMERWRARSGPALEDWLDAVGQFEALSSLAGLAFEHPADPFPELVADGPLFDGSDLGHPLLPAAGCVRNDVRLDGERQLLLVSGSNMSGKSTLLRTVGVNTVLALAGAPVRARRLRLSPLAVGACMRVQDSLQEGLSHFYAEIKRLRRIVDLGSGNPPLLFLLDEILHGTNSHDRRVGADALIRGLLEQGGVGLVTTHDLALARIADELAPRASNVHFEDSLDGEKIVFDYRLRPGIVKKSNALDLMRAVGLDV